MDRSSDRTTYCYQLSQASEDSYFDRDPVLRDAYVRDLRSTLSEIARERGCERVSLVDADGYFMTSWDVEEAS